MASGMRLLTAVMVLAAFHQAAAGVVKATKMYAVKGISKTGSAPSYKIPVFKTTKFTYYECRGHAADRSLTIKDVKGAPVIQYYRSTSYPEENGVRITVTTATATITIITFTPSQELSRLILNLRALTSSPNKGPYQPSVVASLNTVSSYATWFTTAWSQQDCNTNVPYNKDIAKVVSYLKNLAAAIA